MTALAEPETAPADPSAAPAAVDTTPADASGQLDDTQVEPAGRSLLPFTPRRIVAIGVAWLVVTVVGIGCVVYGIGPMLETRDQSDLLKDYRREIRQKAAEAEGLQGIEEVTDASLVGDPVAIVEIPAIDFRQVVVEGVGPSQTRHGPGHVPGTAALGQPSNAVVVGRNAGFGGPFSQLDALKEGDEIGVVTTQGTSVYEVDSVEERSVSKDRDRIYGPSEDDRLTLVTSASLFPLATDKAMVVVAELEDEKPFDRTRQNGFNPDSDGRGGEGAALAVVALAGVGYACAAAAAVLLYRRTRPRSAYLMSAPLLVVSIVLVAESTARLLPAWF